MGELLYVYDCTESRKKNARRVMFTKELYGFVYTWKTKVGVKEKRKTGLLDECSGSSAIADSALLVPDQYRSLYNDLFRRYSDIVRVKLYAVTEQLEV
jgi:hypothetical protein